MHVIALTGRAGSGKDTAALAIRLLTGSIDPTWLMSLEGCPVSGPNRHVVDLKEFFDIKWPDMSNTSKDQWTVRKFAYPVYQIVAILVGRDVEDIMDDPNFKNQVQTWGLTGRQLLQKVGTTFRETIGVDVWVDILNRQLLQLESTGIAGVVISDLRLLNEDEFLLRVWGAHIVKMIGRDSGVPTTHESESELENIEPDYIVDNRLDYKYLMDQLKEICKELNIFNCKYTWK